MMDSLPPRPYGYMITALPGEHEGKGHVYIIDANGRKIACIWGKPDEKMALVTMIIEASEQPG